MSTITVEDGTNPMRPLDYELEGHTLSPLIRCPYSNETSEIREKRPSFEPQLDPGYGLNPPRRHNFSGTFSRKTESCFF
jgi:hypothetical protein